MSNSTKDKTAAKEKPVSKEAGASRPCMLPGGDLLDQGMSVDEVMQTLNSQLSVDEERFCQEYVSCNIAVRAALRVWDDLSYDYASTKAERLMKKDEIRARIAQITEEHKARYALTDSAVLKRLASLVYFDRRTLHKPDGTIKQIHELTEEEALAITEIESVEMFDGRGEDRQAIGVVRKVKFADPHKSIEMAGKHLKLWKDPGTADNPTTVVTKIELVPLGGE